jgi:hypothetical protein
MSLVAALSLTAAKFIPLLDACCQYFVFARLHALPSLSCVHKLQVAKKMVATLLVM